MFRIGPAGPQVLLAHPGGPWWVRKDEGAWTIPKGEHLEGEEPLAAAQREFREETGFTPEGPFIPLGEVRQKSGKRIQAWAFSGDCDPSGLHSNVFELEWPPKSGRMKEFVEIDRAEWFGFDEARRRILPAQAPLLERLEQLLDSLDSARDEPR
jgi:predicted NUDIX family NTP pyrophosphohydrolase